MFKYTLLFLVLAFYATSANAQILKGAKWLGGSVSFSSEVRKSDPGKNLHNNVYLNPAYGIAIKDNQIVGGELELGYGTSKNDNGTTPAYQR